MDAHRSTGTADLAGGPQSGVDKSDNLLRKVALVRDRYTNAVLSAPQATRTVEVLARPKGGGGFALLLNKRLTMSGGVIDSFHSGDPTKSTNGLYDVTKRQSEGNIGINDTEGASNLGSAFVYGDVAYSGAAISNAENVQGTISTPFSQPVTPVTAPTWTSFNATPTNINGTMTLTGGTAAAPAKYKVSGLTVSGGKVLTLSPHATGQASYIEIWVTGKFTTSGSGYILQQAGVNVTYHIQGDVTVSGSSFNNQSNRAANNTVNVINPASGVTQKVTVSGGGNFIGILNAPGAELTLSGSANFSGALVGKTMNISGGASVHYDEALASTSTSGGGWTFAGMAEAVR